LNNQERVMHDEYYNSIFQILTKEELHCNKIALL